MIRMLHIVGSMSPSGIGNFIMNMYRHVDRKKVQFDFIVHERREVGFEEEIISLGGKIFDVPRKSESVWKNFCAIKKVVKKGSYNVVFRHTDTSTIAIDLVAAYLGGAKRRIAHSHSTSTSNKKMHKLFQPLLNFMTTDYFACSKEAGKWLYGPKKKAIVVWNGIDILTFSPNHQIRKEVRQEEDWQQSFVIGHIGNLMPVKNHLFAIDVFCEIKQKKPNAKLIFVGDGQMRSSIEAVIKERNIENSVNLLGVRTDTSRLLQGMDLFLFPSLYEGVPIALVEAQAVGLPCVVSSVIQPDVFVGGTILPIELSNSVQKWANKIVDFIDSLKTPSMADLENSKFNIKYAVKIYEELADEMIKT